MYRFIEENQVIHRKDCYLMILTCSQYSSIVEYSTQTRKQNVFFNKQID